MLSKWRECWKRYKGRRMAALIRKALEGPYYGVRTGQSPYMCVVLRQHYDGLYRKVTRDHIQSKLHPYTALASVIDRVAMGILPHHWRDREQYHRRYFIEMIKRLEAGDFEWGAHPTAEELGLTKLIESREYAIPQKLTDIRCM